MYVELLQVGLHNAVGVELPLLAFGMMLDFDLAFKVWLVPMGVIQIGLLCHCLRNLLVKGLRI